MRYAAFISYRHSELDMEMAKKVHAGLETYRIPRSVQQSLGRKKIGRVFRDQEELPIGSDLDDNITEALKESEYLIVICSPRTPESYWVCKEIDSFIELHDRNHILAVLIEGEPDESFPPQLLVDDNGNPVEPLAADVRGADKKERNSKFKTELLRLAAPIIGCTYDDLKQRHRERVIRRTLAIVLSIAAVVAAAGTAFGVYNANIAARMTQLANEKAALADEKTKLAEEIAVQYKGKQENQSRFYAEKSLSLLQSGNREDAILVAMEGLPSENNDRPYVAEAEFALGRALYAYDVADSMTYDRILQHDLSLVSMKKSEDNRYVISIDNGSNVYVWDTEDWKMKVRIDPTINDGNYYVRVISADADETGVYTATEHELVKYDLNGNALYSLHFGEVIRYCESCGDTGKLIVVSNNNLSLINASDGTVIKSWDDTEGYPFSLRGRYYDETGQFVAAHYDEGAATTYVSIYDLNDTYRDVRISEGYYLDSCVTPSGNIAVISCNSDMTENGVKHVSVDLIAPSGEKIWTREIDAHVRSLMTFNTFIKAHDYTEDGEYYSDIVVAMEAEAFTLNEEDGKMISSFILPGDATALSVSLGAPYGRVGYRQGDIDLVNFREGRIYSDHTFYTESSIREWVVLYDQLAYCSTLSPEIHIVSWHEASDIEDYVTFEDEMIPTAVSPDGSYYAIRPSNDYQKYIFMDESGTELYRYESEKFIQDIKLFNDKAIVVDSDGLMIIDPAAKKEERIIPSDYGFSEYSFEAYINRDGTKCVFWRLRDAMVFDLVNKEPLYTYETDGGLGRLILSDDGSRLYVLQGSKKLYAIDTSTGESIEFKDDKLITVAEGYNKDYISVSPDGKYIAMSCKDGMMRVADTGTFETYAEIPLTTYLRSYVTFTDDGSHIVVQGDDYRIRVFDMNTKSYINTLDGSGSINYIVCDDESGLMAISEGYSMLLLETKGFGRVAYADDGITYLKNNNSILLTIDMMEIKRTYYKDYKELVKEAREQFPEASLSDEKRARYNIE